MSKTAFVFAGGGSLGAVQVGMLHALVAHGVKADFVVGSSVGAINGAYFAGNPTLDGVTKLEALWVAIRRRDVFPVNWRTAAGFLWRRDFLIGSDGLRMLIDSHLPYRQLEDAQIPVHVVATNLLSGAAVVVSRGAAADAIIASSAIPAAFAPISIDGRYLVDGAITSNTPVRVAIGLGAERLIVLPTGFACALQNPPNGAVANALHALTLLIARQLVAELEVVDKAIDFAIVPTLCPRSVSPYDFSRSTELISAAAESTRQWIAAGGLHRREIPDALRAHHHSP
ncbi:MAG: patatin-like phospholipase family protein [Hyphomicrobiaceae bacterium]